MDLDTEYGFVVNSDRNKHEFMTSCGIAPSRLANLSFVNNEAECIWVSGIKSKYKLIPMTVTETKPREGTCPKCHDEGKWVRTALVCNQHGVFGGF